MCNPVFCFVYGKVMCFNHGGGEDPGIYFETPFSVVRKVMFMCVIYVC